MNVTSCEKASFAVIGKEGSTQDGEGFVQKLWADANAHFDQIQDLVQKDEQGRLCGLWGAMSDMSRSFLPWEENFSKGLYLAGAECRMDSEAPEGWSKWVIPAYEYRCILYDAPDTFSRLIAWLKENQLPLVGAVHEFTYPQSGKSYLFAPVRKIG